MFLLFVYFLYVITTMSNAIMHTGVTLCHDHERSALLQFKSLPLTIPLLTQKLNFGRLLEEVVLIAAHGMGLNAMIRLGMSLVFTSTVVYCMVFFILIAQFLA